MSAAWKTVRVFISSTFRDMHAERDHLVKAVFPKLRHWCEERRLHLVDVDLRWGVTKEEADNGKAIEICLKEIDGSRPFFVCILGNRYGWIPHDLPGEELYLFRGLQQDTGLSITHLEIIHAIKEPVTRKDGTRKDLCDQAFFYFRRPECVPEPESLTGLTDLQRQEHHEAFFERNPVRWQMLEDLKMEIRGRFQGQDRVWDYQGTWDATAQNPEDDKLQGRLTGLEEFGDRVEADLKRGIEARFAQHIAALGQAADRLAEERSSHEAFIENRTQIHVPRTDVERQLTEYVEGDDPRPLVVAGPPGSGKSAILAHWVQERTRDDRRGPKEEFLVARFIGASPTSTSLPRLLGNISQELVAHFALTEKVAEEGSGGQEPSRQQSMEVPADPVGLQQKWPRLLAAAAAKGRVVLVLDALDQLDRPADPSRLYWLPRELPPGVRLIVSVLDHGERSRADYLLAPNEPPDWLAVIRRLGCNERPVPDLSDDDRRRIIRELPSVFCKTLGEHQVTQLLESAATRNPLYLTVALEELRVFGSYEKLSAEIGALPRLDDPQIAGDIERALDGLFGRVLARLEGDTARQTPGLVSVLFRLLASAREGLSEEELLGLLARKLANLPPAGREGTMQVVLRQVRPYLMRKAARHGVLVDFYHRSFWKAARTRYLSDAAARHATHRDLAEYFRGQDYWLESPEEQRKRMQPPYTARPANERKVAELPWQLLKLAHEAVTAESPLDIEHAYEQIEQLFCDLPFLEAKNEAGMVFELAGDFSAAVETLPADRQQRRILRLLEEALRRDIHFIDRHPTALFQCMWNSCWWYDCPQVAKYYTQPEETRHEPRSWECALPKLHELLATWHSGKLTSTPGFTWLRSLRPPPLRLGSAQRAVFVGHEGSVNGVAVSPDGQRFASCSNDRTVRIWDLSTAEKIRVLRGHVDWVRSVAFSPDGHRIASGSNDGTVRVWDADTGEHLLLLGKLDPRPSGNWVMNVKYSPDGRRIVSGAQDRVVRVWDAETGSLEMSLAGHTAGVLAIDISPDGCCIASGSNDATVRIWSMANGSELTTLRGHAGPVRCVSLSPDGRVLASGSEDGSLRVWLTGTGEPVHLLNNRDHRVTAVAYSQDGSQIIACTTDKSIQLWDAQLGQRTTTLRGHEDWINDVCCVSHEQILSASDDGTIRLWDMSRESEAIVSHDHGDWVSRLTYSPNRRFVATASHDHSVRVWDAFTGELRSTLLGHEGWVVAVCFTADGRHIVSGAYDNTLRIWSCESGVERWTLRGHSKPVTCVASSPDASRIASGSYDRTVRIWDVSSGEVQRVLQAHFDAVNAVSFDLKGRQLLSAGDDKTVRIWDPVSGAHLGVCYGHVDRILCAEFSPDGKRVAAGASDGTVCIWNTWNCEPKLVVRTRNQSVFRRPEMIRMTLRWSQDGSRIVTQSHERGIEVWDAVSGAFLDRIWGKGDVTAIARDLTCPGAIRAIVRGNETLIESAQRGAPVGCFPMALDPLIEDPAGCAWSGLSQGNHLCMMRLVAEGGAKQRSLQP